MNLAARLSGWFDRRRIRCEFSDAERRFGAAVAELAVAEDPAVRARLLRDVAGAVSRQAGRIRVALNLGSEAGDILYRRLMNQVAVVQALVNVEDVLDFWGERIPADPRIEDAAGSVLNAMVARPDLRSELARTALHDALWPVVGGAADILLTLYPANVDRVPETGPVR